MVRHIINLEWVHLLTKKQKRNIPVMNLKEERQWERSERACGAFVDVLSNTLTALVKRGPHFVRARWLLLSF